jgi:hypothetical protein
MGGVKSNKKIKTLLEISPFLIGIRVALLMARSNLLVPAERKKRKALFSKKFFDTH